MQFFCSFIKTKIRIMKKVLLCFVVWGISSFMMLGKSAINSQINRSQISNNDSLRVVKLLDSAYYHIYRNNDSSMYFCKKAQELAEKQDIEIEKANALNMQGIIFLNKAEYIKTIQYSRRGLDILKKLKPTYSNQDYLTNRFITFYNTLGNAYNYLSDYDQALINYLDAAKNAEKIEKNNSLMVIYSNIGTVYNALKNVKFAISYYNKALKIARQEKNLYQTATSYINLSEVYYENSKIDSAYYFIQKSIPLLSKLKNNVVLSTSYIQLAQIYAQQKRFEKATETFQKAYSVLQQSKYERGYIFYYSSLGSFYKSNKHIEQSIISYKKALQLAKKYGEKLLEKDIAISLSTIYADKKDYQSVYYYTQISNAIKDSLYSEKMAHRIALLQSNFEIEKNKIIIDKLQQKNIFDNKIKKLLFIIIILLLLSSIIVIYGYRQKRKKNQIKHKLLQLNNEKIKNELDFINKQMITQTLMILKKNKMLNSLQETINMACKTSEKENREQLYKIKKQIKQNLKSEKDWDLFKKYFEQINTNFYNHLSKINPNLTPNDYKMAALIKLNLSIKEVATLLNLSVQSIKGARYRLRKKLHLDREDNLAAFIAKID